MTNDPRPYAREYKGGQPPYLHSDYGSTVKRAPKRGQIRLEHTLSEVTGPTFTSGWAGPEMADLTRQHSGEPIGERIIVAGRVLDEDGRPVAGTLLEMWQANSAGRYIHPRDQHPAPLDPNFTGAGQVLTNERGEWRFLTIKPGAYPWRNTHNAWRAQHLHFSVFGPGFVTRIVTQMYFPGDPLLAFDPIYHSIADGAARERLISAYDPGLSEAEFALGYRFDIVLRGRLATPTES
ncbi:MAG: protocatechuate 3,4-dioxygenase subunit beta [Alphaproteobacteria bacterium]|nr:protocatechuate 3,4-dioxygenase subunit beta [Alphaproteobacteria bacterium]